MVELEELNQFIQIYHSEVNMADQYQNFTNPTIIPDHPVGWQAANSNLADVIKNSTQYVIQQHQKIQDLQLQQAQDLSKFRTLDQVYYGGQHGGQIDALLAQNPYGKSLVNPNGPLSQQGTSNPSGSIGTPGMGASMIGFPGMNNNITGQSMLPMPTTGSNGTSMSPVNPTGGGPVITSMTQKAFEAPSMTIQNPAGEAAVQGAKSQAEANVAVPTEYAKNVVGSKAKEDTAFNSLNAMSDNLVSSLKGVLAQQGGGGIIPEATGFVASKLGMANTGLIKGMTAVKRDTAIAYARTLANGSQGVQKLMEKVADTLPDGGFTSEQAGSTVAEMKFTAMALKVAADKLKLTPDQIDNMSEEQLQMLVNSGKTQLGGKQAQDQIYQQISQQFAQTEPRQSIDLEGNVKQAEANPIAKMLHMKYGGSQNPVTNTTGNQSNIKNQYNQLRASGVSAADAKKQLGL